MLCEQHHKLQFVQVHWIWKSNIIEFRISQGRNSLSFPPTTMKVASSLSQWIKTNLFMSLPWNFCFTWLYRLCTASWDEEIYQAVMDSVEACENIEITGGGDINDELMTLLSRASSSLLWGPPGSTNYWCMCWRFECSKCLQTCGPFGLVE